MSWCCLPRGESLLQYQHKRRFSREDYTQLRPATDNFNNNNKVGRGGFGTVYKFLSDEELGEASDEELGKVLQLGLGAGQGAPRGAGGRLGAGRGAAARLVTLVKELREALELGQALVEELGEATRLEQRDGGWPTARGLEQELRPAAAAGLEQELRQRRRASSRSSGWQWRRAWSRSFGAGGGPRAGAPAAVSGKPGAGDLHHKAQERIEIMGESRAGAEITGRWDRGQVSRSQGGGIVGR